MGALDAASKVLLPTDRTWPSDSRRHCLTCCRIESNHPDWRKGDWALGSFGWQRFAISDGFELRRVDAKSAPPSAALGVLGMPGFTSYAGLRNIGYLSDPRRMTIAEEY